jgi:hypothetical protein
MTESTGKKVFQRLVNEREIFPRSDLDLLPTLQASSHQHLHLSLAESPRDAASSWYHRYRKR